MAVRIAGKIRRTGESAMIGVTEEQQSCIIEIDAALKISADNTTQPPQPMHEDHLV